MRIWAALYSLVWAAFFQFVLVLLPLPDSAFLLDLHAMLGIVILALAHYNNSVLRKTEAPARLKRVAKTTAILATAQPVFGVLLFLNVVAGLSSIVLLIHLVTALAIITQASSVATGYDMWEEREFVPTSRGPV